MNVSERPFVAPVPQLKYQLSALVENNEIIELGFSEGQASPRLVPEAAELDDTVAAVADALTDDVELVEEVLLVVVLVLEVVSGAMRVALDVVDVISVFSRATFPACAM